MKTKTYYLQGMLGGFIVIAIFMLILVSSSFFNYRIRIDKFMISNTTSNNQHGESYSSIYDLKNKVEEDLRAKLKNDSYILTPAEYTNNIVSYYNTFLLILSVMLAAFSFLSFIYIKSLANDFIQEQLNSDDFQENVSYKIAGDIEGRLRDEITALQDSMRNLQNRVADHEIVIEDN